MPYKTLIVDDEEAVKDLFVELLKTQNHEVKTASTGEEALEAINREAFDIVLLDIKLPGISGLDTLKKIKELRSDLVVIMITGFAHDDELIEKSKEYGCAGYIVKNMMPSEILKNFDSIAKTLLKKK